MANVTVSTNPSTTGNTLTVYFTTDVTNITDVFITNDDSNYIRATSFTSTYAIFDVSSWNYGTYSNCHLKLAYKDDEEVPSIILGEINSMTVNKGEEFYIYYTSNVPAVKHEFSWDNGNTYWDKTSEVIVENDTNYKYLNQAESSYDSYNVNIRVTDAKGNTSLESFTITFVTASSNNFTFTQYRRIDDGVVNTTDDETFYSTINAIEVEAGSTYIVNLNSSNYVCVVYYDVNDNYLGYYEDNTSDWVIGTLSTTFTVPSNTQYIRVCATSDGTQITGALVKSTSLLDSNGAYIVDDFSSGTIDSNKWSYELGYVRNGETQRYTNTNAEVNDGILALRGLKDSDGNWTSSSIISHNHFAFMYGRIEARVRACNYNGSFGAFWTLGDSFEFGYNEWGSPDTLGEWWAWCGEFDVMEFYSGNLTCGTFFNEKEESGRVWYNNYDTGAWHVFAMEWNEDGSLKFYIDDNLISSTSATDNRAFHIPHYILLNQAVGASGGTPDSWCSEITQYVDWVKYYPLSTDNIVLNSYDFYLQATDFNNSSYNCVVRPVFNDNCINKSVTWSSSNSSLINVHAGLCSSYAGANGTAVITATSHSGVSSSITLKATNGVLSVV